MTISRPRRMIARGRIAVRVARRRCPNMLTFIAYGVIVDLALNLYKPFGTKFLQRLGGGEWHITLFNALPGLFAVCAIIPGSMLINRFADKRRVTAAFFLLARLCLILAAMTPFFAARVRPLSFVLIIAAMNFPDAIAQCAFQSHLGAALQDDYRARAISWRTGLGCFIVPFATLLTGLIIAFVPKTDAQRLIAYQCFFAAAFVGGLVELALFMRLKPLKPTALAAHKTRLADALRDKRFTRFLLCTLAFYLTWQAGWPLFNMIVLLDLRANEMWLAMQAVGSGVAAFIASNLWRERIRRKGNSRAMVEAAFGLAANAALNAVSPNNFIMTLTATFGGLVSVGLLMTLLNGLLESTPDEGRIVYIGVYNTCVAASLAVSAFIAHAVFLVIGARHALLVVALFRTIAAAMMAVVLLKRRSKTN